MQVKHYKNLDETLYTDTLANGLKVALLPKAGFHKTYAVFTTNYGSIDSKFVPLGQQELTTVPDGIAHFLEHKMFDKKDGDVFEVFGRYGASSNAFTSFTRTSYLFSATNHVQENLTTLLDFVQDPYFTPKTVAKEKGIIGQEIEMYDDDPNWRLFFGIVQNLYPKHPVRIDIAGTVESIAKITADDLYLAYQTFYHPSNMNLFVVGNIDANETLKWITANQETKTFAPAAPIQRQFPTEAVDGSDIIPYRVIEMPVNRGKSVVGIKGLDQVKQDRSGLVYRTTLNLLFDLLFGDSSANYLRLYDKGVIDDTFGYELNVERTFHFAALSGDTNNPQELSDAIIAILDHAAASPELTADRLELVKKEALGRLLQSFNSLEFIANEYSGDHFGDATLFDLVQIIEQITLTDVKQVAESFIRQAAISVFHIEPKEG
ncbi:EF-P 5-aminopentanol modification-associated protein YfmH [Loigolactobacillus backii]|uniref:EF-P 5-aminopentanol modification-associated protein YfmH n=1 Tax=Loigolactobacillus backii TaxID=375175 RepID=UPI0022FD55DE|nr:pitrilysin family protein [Loigolactobacillus backii]MDA5386553.1 insulinase family protein [Loigolactobacillus backii]MDA5389080.1 insulinase family protein [Loigolactobacillus backii]